MAGGVPSNSAETQGALEAGGLQAGGTQPGGRQAENAGYRGIRSALLLPTWGMIGVFLALPVALVVVYSFLTKEFRGGVIWDFTLTAYDQFFFSRGLFGDEAATLEWTYIGIFWRSVWQAGLATAICLLVGFPTAWFIATRPARSRPVWLFLITNPYWVNLLIRTVSLKILIRDNGPLNELLLGLGVISDPLPLVNTNLAVQLGLFYSYLPFMVLPVYAAVERYNFALTLQKASFPADAARELETLIAQKPDNGRSHLLLGNLYAQDLADTAKAREHYLKVLVLEQQHPQAAAIRSWLVAHP